MRTYYTNGIATNMKTPTPRTDAIQELSYNVEHDEEVALAFTACRTLERELTAVTEQRDRLAEALIQCREDSVELLGDRDWWQNTIRLDYQKRYQEARDNVTRADKALQSLNQPTNMKQTKPNQTKPKK